MKKRYFVIIPFSLIILLFLSQGSWAVEDQISPFIVKVLNSPQPVRGSDGEFHLLYELKLTNALGQVWGVDQLEVLDGMRSQIVLATFRGEQLKKRMVLIGTRKFGTVLRPNETGVILMHLRFSSQEKIPSKFVHRLKAISHKRILKEIGGSTVVENRSPIIIESPLKGERWLVGFGCCEVENHALG